MIEKGLFDFWPTGVTHICGIMGISIGMTGVFVRRDEAHVDFRDASRMMCFSEAVVAVVCNPIYS